METNPRVLSVASCARRRAVTRAPSRSIVRSARDARARAREDGGGESASDVLALARLRGALARVDEARSSAGGRWREVEGAHVRLPSMARPWACAHFVGGAVLGSAPRTAYDALLSRCAEEGVVVIATPYDLDLDHGRLSRECGEMYARARARVCEDEGLDPRTTPTFRFGHSLGCKLLTLLACEEDARASGATGSAGVGADGTIDMDVDETSGTAVAVGARRSESDVAVAGHFLVAFNNADATDSVRLIEKFARELLKTRGGGASAAASDLFGALPSLAAFAERAAKAAGLEFEPTPEETLERARTRFVSRRTRLIKFKKDDLDQNDQLLEALKARFKVYPGRVDARELDFGNHLTPVFFSTDGLKLSPALDKLIGQFSFGDEEGVRKLAAEFAAFIREK